MGTNFATYAPATCNNPDHRESLHIGKSSAGWKFSFRAYDDLGLTSWAAWKALRLLPTVVHVTYVYYDLDWAPLFRRRCRSRFVLRPFRGRCELRRHHDGDHAAERGMVWVRWNAEHAPWLTGAGERCQGWHPDD